MDTDLRQTSDQAAPHLPPLPLSALGAGAATTPLMPSNLPSNLPAFPAARVPVAPVLSLASFFGAGAPPVPSILDAGEAKLVTSGRIAIALALLEMKIGPGMAVLVPSFHCASMIEPVTWSGATPVFYKINADTSVDLADVASKIDARTKVLMVTNYFGFPQDLSAIRAFCDQHGLWMLEDCAHCFLGQHKGMPVGSFGDYAIASSMKFFPIYEGGALVSSRHSLAGVTLQAAGRGFEIKAALNAFEDSFQYGRLGLVQALLAVPLKTKDLLWRALKARKTTAAASMAPGSSDGGFSFDPAWLHKRSSVFSRWLLQRVSRPRMGALRRKNYQSIAAALAGLPGCRALFMTLPDGVFPWVFPLLCENTAAVFPTLKSQGVPIIRFGEYLWPGVDASVCANSVALSRHVMSFSCHQELRDDELDWMILKIKEAVQMHRALP